MTAPAPRDPQKTTAADHLDVSAGEALVLPPPTAAKPPRFSGIRWSRQHGKWKGLPKRLASQPLRQSPLALRIVMVAFFLQWLFGTLSGILIGHFTPASGATAQFITLLLSTLGTFTCAVLATIELSKMTAGGRSVALGVAWINVAVYLLLGFYARHWILGAGQLIFALAALVILSGETTRVRLLRGIALLLLGYAIVLTPGLMVTEVAPDARAWLEEAQTAYRQRDREALATNSRAAQRRYGLLATLAPAIGTNPGVEAQYRAGYAAALALAGDPEGAYAQVNNPADFGDFRALYDAKALSYALMHGLRYEPRVEREVPPGARIDRWLQEAGEQDFSDAVRFLEEGEPIPERVPQSQPNDIPLEEWEEDLWTPR